MNTHHVYIYYNKAYRPEVCARIYNIFNHYFTSPPTLALFIKKKPKSFERVDFGPGAAYESETFL